MNFVGESAKPEATEAAQTETENLEEKRPVH
jgi:hypothetical protein